MNKISLKIKKEKEKENKNLRGERKKELDDEQDFNLVKLLFSTTVKIIIK